MPPSASTSRTRCPLATPPTAGLQLICAIRSMFMVMSAVLSPMRAAAIAASHPACPAPTTTTSYCSVNAIESGKKPRSEEHTSELQSLRHLVCRLLLEKKKKKEKVHAGREIGHTSDCSGAAH